MREIRVTFDDGNTLETCINGSDEGIKLYYTGRYFNFGTESDCMVKALSVEFLDKLDQETGVTVV